MDTYIFFLKHSFPKIYLDQLKYRFGSVNITLNQLISVWSSNYCSRWANIDLDGLNIKDWLILVRIG